MSKFKIGDTVYNKTYGKGVITWSGRILYEVSFYSNHLLMCEEGELSKKEPVVIVSEIDPYGEENWDE